jgi:hypothetical protein
MSSSNPRFDFSFQMPLRQGVVEFLATERFGFVRFWSLPSISRQPADRELTLKKRSLFARPASARCKKACPIHRCRKSQSKMPHGVKRGVWVVKGFEARSKKVPPRFCLLPFTFCFHPPPATRHPCCGLRLVAADVSVGWGTDAARRTPSPTNKISAFARKVA